MRGSFISQHKNTTTRSFRSRKSVQDVQRIEDAELVQTQERFVFEAHEVVVFATVSFRRELHKEIIRLHDIPGVTSDSELTEVLRELAEIMVHGEKQSDEYFRWGCMRIACVLIFV